MSTRYRHDLTGFIGFVGDWLERYRVAPSAYTRHLHRDGYDATRPDLYGCAGAANILYMLGRLPSDSQDRTSWIATLQGFQDPATGVFTDPTHSDYHTTAHGVAALELFDARPMYPLTFLHELSDPRVLHAFLDSRDWDLPWPASHDGAGAASALAITGEIGKEWERSWLDWFDDEVDPSTGLWRRGRMSSPDEWPGLFGNLAGSFHYHFVYEHLRQPWPYPERVIDTALQLLYDSAGSFIEVDLGFKDIDLVFCLSRARRQTPHRFDEVTAALELLVDRTGRLLADPEYLASPALDDVHATFGAICTVAELQRAVPGSIDTGEPLRLVLDRRPFI